MYRLLHPGAAAGEVHAQGEGQLQVQALAGGGVQPLRVLHHAPHRPQHAAPHDEGKVVCCCSGESSLVSKLTLNIH